MGFTVNDYFISAKIEDVSTAGQIYIPVIEGGKIVEVASALNGAIGTADAVLTIKTAEGTAGTITITQSGSAAGDFDSVEPTTNNNVVSGGTIEVETNGASTNTISVDLQFRIRR